MKSSLLVLAPCINENSTSVLNFFIKASIYVAGIFLASFMFLFSPSSHVKEKVADLWKSFLNMRH